MRRVSLIVPLLAVVLVGSLAAGRLAARLPRRGSTAQSRGASVGGRPATGSPPRRMTHPDDLWPA